MTKSIYNIFTLVAAAGLASATLAHAQQYTISTIAGLPQVQGYAGNGGPASGAQLLRPLRVSVDSKGNYYIADLYSDVVRMVTASTGNIDAVAGNGLPGFSGDGQSATAASITDIHGVAADGNGNIYIADTTNSRVRKVDSKGQISTFAGNGTQGYGGDGTDARGALFFFPSAIVIDGSGNVIVSDYGNSTVRKITSTGAISTLAGTGVWGISGDGGPANKAALAAPVSMAIDAAGNLYIGDVGSQSIRKIGTDGNISTVYSNVVAQSLAVDSTGLYFVDGVSHVVKKIVSGGTVLTIAGTGVPGFSGDGGPGTSAQLNLPGGVAVDSTGKVYVADTNNQVIRLLTPIAFSVGNVNNAASGASGPVSPGEIVALFGTGIGPATLTTFTLGANGLFPTTIGGASVTFNGTPAPLIYASSGVVAAIAPYALQGSGTADIAVTYQGKTSVTTTVPVAAAAPGIFTANSTGSGQAAALNSDLKLNSASNPAKAGSIIVLYVTGEGQTFPNGGVDGKPAGIDPERPVQTVKVIIGGQTVFPDYAGSAATLVAGMMQVNARIPATIATNSAVPVQVTVGGIASPATATIAVTQ